METRFVPDVPGAWLVYDLGTLVLALPPEFRAAADAVAASPHGGVAAVIDALRSSGIADSAPFAVLGSTGGGLSVALRGPATVAVGDEVFTGLGAEPWAAHSAAGATVARLTVPGGEWTLAFPSTPVVRPAPPVIAVPALVAPPPPLLEPRDEITEVPELSTPVSRPETPAAPAVAEAEADDKTVALDDRPRRPAVSVAATPAEDKTVVVDEIAQLRAKRSAGLADPVAPASIPVPPVAASLSLELPDGSREPLDAVVLVGRAPAPPAEGVARLVRLADGDISRNHARIAVEGGTVVVTDLGSRNGTVVRIPGRPAQKLRGGEPTPVLVGTVIDFGGGVELRVREG